MKILALLAAFLTCFNGNLGNSDELLGRFTVTGEGFHKDLGISFSLPASWNQCSLLLKWTIPSGAYVDPYQLEALTNVHTHFVIGNVDIEQTQQLSLPITFYQLSKLSCKENCVFAQTFPLHSRYHSPNHGGNPATVDLNPPQIFSSCGPINNCIDDNNPSCKWEPLTIAFKSINSSFKVPVGDLNHVPLVTALTLLITALGTAFTAWK